MDSKSSEVNNEKSGKKNIPVTYAPKQFDKLVCDYLDNCDNNNVFPDEAGMILSLGISEREYKLLCGKEEYTDTITRAKLFRESWLARVMVSDNKRAQGCLNALKQEKNGGYIDRPIDRNEPRTLTIKLSGVGQEAFK